MISRIFLAITLILLATFAIQAQSPLVSFHQPTADLGTIIDNQGTVAHRFTFVNNSDAPVLVDNVDASCGCTSTEWSTDVVNPGDEGFIEVLFDPYNRPGPFDKQVMAYFKDFSDAHVLTISGFVKPASASIEEEFPIKMGDLRAKERFLDLGTITSRTLFSKSFDVYNESNQILVFSDDMVGPNHITVTFEPYTLKPRSAGRMWVHYDVGAKNDLGFFSEDVAIFTYESADNRKSFTITATLLDAPAAVSPQSPRVHFDQKEIDFGIKQQGEPVMVVFPVQNHGSSTLRLKKVFGNCNCIKVNPSSIDLEPGESAEIAVQFTTDERLGNQEKTITIFTDDPLLPVAILKLKGRLRGSRN